jgi:hypothetical protein
MTDEQIKKLALISAVVGLIAGVVIATLLFKVSHANYYEVHQANIGGFIFKGGHIYSLTEMMTDEGVSKGITK